MSLSQETELLEPWTRALRPGLRLDPLESAGREISEAETEAVIRQVLCENAPPRSGRATGRAALPDLAPQEELSARKAARAARQAREAAAAPAAAAPPVEDLRPEPAARPRPAARKLLRRALPWVALGAVVWLWPWAIPIALFVAFWVVLIVCATVGSDWIGRGTLRLYRWLEARNPDRAERLRVRADAVALRLDGLLDRLPDRWTEGLYLPDFSRAALSPDTLDDRPDPFDRIAAEARGI